ncbi:DUF6907 domain-containing protein [Streptomyces sp. NPDC007856]|uniref:DUF6907 domain-containing protein n=1 Tax=Streptomyces sp. NPDC007856 TaxID=3364781 RepID=UPI0036AC25F8
MSTEPRTATVNILVTKPLEIDEPDWCTGHRTDQAQFKPDITHYGPEHTIAANGIPVCRAMLSQSPFASSEENREVCLYVEECDFTGSYAPDEVEQLADAFTQAADRLRALGHDLSAALAGGGQ